MTKVKLSNILLFVIACVLCFLAVVPKTTAFADTTDKTISEDLSGTNFDISNYPVVLNDYSLNVISISETVDGGLVVYVYQPSAGNKNTIATSINIATDIVNYSDRQNYKLTLLASYSTITKFKVDGLRIGAGAVRYYDISSIYRSYNKDVDGVQSGNSTVDEKAYAVNQQWTVTMSEDGSLSYEMSGVETVTVTDRFDGTLRYVNLDNPIDGIDRHFIAFSTDYDIDTLLSADVTYVLTKGVCDTILSGMVGKPNTGEPEPPTTTHVERDDLFSNTSSLEYKDDYFEHVWYGIETVSDFLEKEKIRDDVKPDISNKQWVLSFLVTDVKFLFPQVGIGPVGTLYRCSYLSEVSILQLRFEVDGKSYNLGVVDDKITKDPFPINWKKPKSAEEDLSIWEKIWNGIKSFFKAIGDFFSFLFGDFSDSWWAWLIILAVIFVVLLFIPVIGPILISGLKIVGKGLLWLLKGLWWLICLPFKGIAALVRKIKEKRGTA